MVDNHKKSISWRFIFALLFSVAIIALVFFALPLSIVHPSGVGAYETGGDSATGLGTPILPSGTWFMYNEYAGGSGSFDIQAGNPSGGENIIGSFTITNNHDGTYTADYTMNGGITVVNEHLAISDTPFTSANPGYLDNADYGVPFSPPADGSFYIFAHFSVEY